MPANAGCLQSASAPDVPFCAGGWMAMPVVLARRSVVGRRREIADSGASGGTHSTGCRARFWVRCGQRRRPPCLLPLLRPQRHFGAWGKRQMGESSSVESTLFPKTRNCAWQRIAVRHGLTGLAAMRLACGLRSRPCAARNSCAFTARPAFWDNSATRSGVTS